MFKNYFNVALRNLLKQRTFSAINIFCLAIGLACCVLIFLFVQHEWQHDKFHQNAADIYRLVLQSKTPIGAGINRDTLFPDKFAEAMIKEFPAVVRASGFIRTWVQIAHEGKSFVEVVGEVDASFLDMFTFPLLAGNAATALSQPNNAVISESVARKFFGEKAAVYAEILGKVLAFRAGGESQDFIITGVMAEVPKTSSFQFDVLIPIEHNQRYSIDSNWAGATTVYLQLAKETDVARLEASFPPFIEKHLGALVKKHPELGLVGEIKEALELHLQPLREIYLDNRTENHYLVTGNATYSMLLAAIAMLILFIACVNFMTLSIGRSAGRALEIGMRKVLGATRTQIIRQFWGEAILLSVLAMLLGLGLAELFLPVFNTLAQKQFSLAWFDQWQTLAILLGTMLLTVSTPAIKAALANPVEALRYE